MKALLIATLFLAIGAKGTSAFALQNGRRAAGTIATTLCMAADIDDDDVDPPLPGQMKISEIKSELDLRQISHKDCFDRESLELRLIDARSSGKADPSIIDEFNKRNLEANVKGETFEVSDEVIEQSVGGDGTLPGGMPPDMLKAMMSDEELVTMLRSPKMQEIMKLVMSSGPEDLENAMKEDKETYECVMKLNKIMGKMNQS
eukprot:CAMPEP_0172535220 /NCGR_PEP_ID=MMETSP1067-20121228/7332_1 /TAXON_ID=265564 ORGANISM="Thalassiosira punctigera, Strain Tpunct2005C2" /NCGR_SAMPLE_ID=MMETSP1067 /ASSEMBLY_ACC=CAM_ASM_000444 /LENGTH=202 /DNA_ID=CAMNT_0013320137 /DNA_START=77 /DNA_END=685 /DNA_ORIENTATION=+